MSSRQGSMKLEELITTYERRVDRDCTREELEYFNHLSETEVAELLNVNSSSERPKELTPSPEPTRSIPIVSYNCYQDIPEMTEKLDFIDDVEESKSDSSGESVISVYNEESDPDEPNLNSEDFQQARQAFEEYIQSERYSYRQMRKPAQRQVPTTSNEPQSISKSHSGSETPTAKTSLSQTSSSHTHTSSMPLHRGHRHSEISLEQKGFQDHMTNTTDKNDSPHSHRITDWAHRHFGHGDKVSSKSEKATSLTFSRKKEELFRLSHHLNGSLSASCEISGSSTKTAYHDNTEKRHHFQFRKTKAPMVRLSDVPEVSNASSNPLTQVASEIDLEMKVDKTEDYQITATDVDQLDVPNFFLGMTKGMAGCGSDGKVYDLHYTDEELNKLVVPSHITRWKKSLKSMLKRPGDDKQGQGNWALVKQSYKRLTCSPETKPGVRAATFVGIVATYRVGDTVTSIVSACFGSIPSMISLSLLAGQIVIHYVKKIIYRKRPPGLLRSLRIAWKNRNWPLSGFVIGKMINKLDPVELNKFTGMLSDYDGMILKKKITRSYKYLFDWLKMMVKGYFKMAMVPFKLIKEARIEVQKFVNSRFWDVTRRPLPAGAYQKVMLEYANGKRMRDIAGEMERNRRLIDIAPATTTTTSTTISTTISTTATTTITATATTTTTNTKTSPYEIVTLPPATGITSTATSARGKTPASESGEHDAGNGHRSSKSPSSAMSNSEAETETTEADLDIYNSVWDSVLLQEQIHHQEEKVVDSLVVAPYFINVEKVTPSSYSSEITQV